MNAIRVETVIQQDGELHLTGIPCLDYAITGGTGLFAGAYGFGLAFLDFDPMGTFNNYQESGVLVFSVPAPATLALVLAGLAAVAVSRRNVSIDARLLLMAVDTPVELGRVETDRYGVSFEVRVSEL